MIVSSDVPGVTTPILDANGLMNPVWYQFFLTLLRRTGGTDGNDSADESARITAVEKLARDTQGSAEAQVQVNPIPLDAQPLQHFAQLIQQDNPLVLTRGHGTQNDSSLHDVATPMLNGFMSAADKARVDALAPGQSPTFVAVTLTNGQLVFPAAQVPSANPNTLDDYEEGVWTPVITFTTPGNLAVTYTTQAGIYTKIGRSVIVSFVIDTATFTWTTSTGNLLITGFPFAALGIPQTPGKVDWSGITKVGYTEVSAIISSGNTFATMVASGSGVARTVVTTADVPTITNKFLSGFIIYNT